MKKFLLTCAVVAVTSTAALVGTQSAARADCGMHQFQSASVQTLRKFEAEPLTPTTVLINNDRLSDFDPGSGRLQMPRHGCDDESDMSNYTAVALGELWSEALSARGAVAVARFVAAGESDSPRGCSAFAKMQARSAVAGYFEAARLSNQSAATWASVSRSLYYRHILGIWQRAFQDLGMTQPSLTDKDMTNIESWKQGHEKAAMTAAEHLPDGVKCKDDIFLYVGKKA